MRTFRVSRVQSVRQLEEPAVRPESFDLAGQWAASSAAFFETWPTYEVRVRVRAGHLWHLRDVLEPGAAKEAMDAAAEADADGWRETTVRVESMGMAVHELLRFGSHLEVLEPADLRDAMRRVADEMAAQYASAPV